MKNFKDTFNIAKEENFESLRGYAGQELVLGRLMLCGFNVQRSLWRDAKYDGIFVVNKIPIRIEIKSSINNEFGTTSGRRAGKQIDKNAPKRIKPISTVDADFMIGVSVNDATCWVLPVEIIEITQRTMWPEHFISKFKEKFKIFLGNKKDISSEDIAKGFRSKNESELENICKKNNINISNKNKDKSFIYPSKKIYNNEAKKAKKIKTSYKDSLVLDIWIYLFNTI